MMLPLRSNRHRSAFSECLCLTAFWRDGGRNSVFCRPVPEMCFQEATLKATSILVALQVPLGIGNAFLILRQLACIAANLTTNELISRRKYSYLRAEDGGFWNPFDRGCFSNCQQFWCLPRPDWAAVYQQSRQVRNHVPGLSGCLLMRDLKNQNPREEEFAVCSREPSRKTLCLKAQACLRRHPDKTMTSL